MKWQKDMTPQDESPRSEGIQYATGEKQKAITNSSSKNAAAGRNANNIQVWVCLVVKVKSSAVKSNIA